MAKIFITGSTDGLGLLAAQQLITDDHEVYLHARNTSRADQVMEKIPGTAKVLIAELSDLKETKQLANDLNDLGRFDAIIHNAGVLSVAREVIFAVNVLAPYVLTSLVELPERLIYLSSGMHKGGRPLMKVSDANNVSYSDSKLQVTTLMKAVSRLCPYIFVNAVDPGWVPTKMGGPGASDDLQKGYETQTWLAVSQEKEALISGGYFFHQKQQSPRHEVNQIDLQEKLIEICAEISGVPFPFYVGS